jgi:DNA-binding NtrC family response regulator
MEAPRTPRILVVDDDGAVQVSLALLLKQSGFDALCCDGPAAALALLASQPFDLVLQDMNFSLQTSGAEGLALLEQIRQRYPTLPVLLMTAWGSIALAVAGIKAGAANFFTKPWDNAQLMDLIAATLQLKGPDAEGPGRKALDAQFDFDGIVGEHSKLLRVLATIGQVARTRAPVLILGESGTGKELVADAIHRNSPRAQQAIVKINMGAITPTLFESEMFGHVRGAFTDARSDRKGHVACADGGTLFLDEIGEMPLGLQTRLLRVLEEREVMRVGGTRPVPISVRVISATHCDLEARVREGRFRADLFYRLAVLRLALPPLRARREDIVPLAEWSLKHALAAVDAKPHRNLHAEIRACAPLLEAYDWPGNARELRNLMERLALFLAGEPLQALTPSFLLSIAPELGAGKDSPAIPLADPARESLAEVMARFGGQRDAAARHLGISRTTLWRRLKSENLS